jgi:hypothetical protein
LAIYFFVNVSENSIMVDDVMFSNPPIPLVKGEKLEKTPLNVNVSQWSCEK